MFIRKTRITKILSIAALTALLTIPTNFSASAAQNDISVIVSGTEVSFADQQPVMQDGRVLVPVRGVFEKLNGADGTADYPFAVSWDDATQTATIKNFWYTVTIKAGSKTFTANGKTITPDVAPQIINGRLMMPLRAISEAVDATVEWDDDTREVKIFYESLIKISPM